MANLKKMLEHAIAHHRAGRLDEAERGYRSILRRRPKDPDAIHLLGLVRHAQEDHVEAERLIRKAIGLDPKTHVFHNSLGEALRAQHRIEESVDAFRASLRRVPKYPEALNNLGNAYRDLGLLEQAAAAYQQSMEARPGFVPAITNLGIVLRELGHQEAALDVFTQLLQAGQDSVQIRTNVGLALCEVGRPMDAVPHLREAYQREPTPGTLGNLVQALGGMRFEEWDAWAEAFLSRSLRDPEVDHRNLIPAVLSLLQLSQPLADLLKSRTPLDTSAMDALQGQVLFLNALRAGVLPDMAYERVITDLRRSALLEEDVARAPLIAPLAIQCFLTEYIHSVTDEEAERVDALGERIESALAVEPFQIDADLGLQIALYAAYRSPTGLDGHERLKEVDPIDWGIEVGELVTVTVLEPLRERILRDRVTALTEIGDGVSSEVQAQYEVHPYPRWRHVGRYQARSLQAVIQSQTIGYSVPPSFPTEPEVLIAGCGTGRHPLGFARTHAKAKVLAVDLSRTSLAYAARKAEDLGVGNVEFAQADIMKLGEIDRTFDHIECVGVLHHLEDPLAGWKVIEGMLRPGCAMKIGLYSEIARRDIVEARAAIEARGFAGTDDDIRAFRALAREDPELLGRLVRLNFSRDFYTLSATRDLLFHVQEHRLTLPTLAEWLDELGLEFRGFVFQSGSDSPARFREMFPEVREDPKLGLDLAKWHAFEEANPHTFIAMYNFYVQKPR